jgi:C-terminal processing protease CtpA/Prc
VIDTGAAARENHGFRRVEVLPGNVGVLELTLFSHFQPDEPVEGSARGVADAALALLARSQALIVDLRDCRGGSPAMVGYLIGHFVAENADVYNTFKSRGPDQFERPTVPIEAPRRLDLPLYVLTSGRTGSGAESFAYTLQAAGRATVVGERSAGGANPGGFLPVGDGLAVFVSGGRPVNPITQTNWEGVGVQPDRAVSAADAQSVAYELALEAALGRGGEGPAAIETRWALEAARAQRSSAPLDAEERARLAGAFGERIIRDAEGALVYVVDRRPPRRLVPLGADTFTLDGAPLTRLDFERDAAGNGVVLVMRQASGGVARYPRSTPAG